MNAQEHAIHAEQLLDWAADDDLDDAVAAWHLSKAQAHATLALALEQRNTNTWLQDIAGYLDTWPKEPTEVSIQLDGKAITRAVNDQNKRDGNKS
jgi:hypothetical protein